MKTMLQLVCSITCLFSLSLTAIGQDRRIVFLAGRPSHGYGSHEHLAGSRIIADAIQKSAPGIKCEVYAGGWPEDDSVLDGADAIVMYADGGGGHPALAHLDVLGKHMARGAGFACLHYAVEVPKDKGGPEFLKWLGGYFETNWSVNPHWDANYTSLPEHPATRGVTPFVANDEWYFHMRFQPNMKGVTPLLSAVPPESTMNRPDGPHSGNPAVRKEVAERMPQHMAWVYERPEGGRSFGFTGGHYHWNWGREEILKLTCNAICWTAKAEIPANGLPVLRPAFDALKNGQDEQIPEKFDAEKTRTEFKLISTGVDEKNKSGANTVKGKLLFSSPVVTSKTPGHKIDIEVDLQGAKKIFLVTSDGGDGFTCDWADWINPTLIANDKQIDMTTLTWTTATSQWGNVNKNKNAAEQPLQVNSKSYEKGIGTHANSVIGFDVPAGATKFKAMGGLDNGGTEQQDGATTSIRFQVYADAPPVGAAGEGSQENAHDPQLAVEGLTVAPGLAATLTASEPELLSLTNLDIDHKGRIWVCEVVNYRRHNGERPEGDRILILEDTDQDGKADKSKVYYQGRDIDSAMGICVLGNRVIVSASPNVWIFTDEDGDDKPDRKELFFTKTGDPQHDHSAHSFLFGPDGKLYWNFGNTGHTVHDAAGKIVVDKAGNEVRDNGKPYTNGMPFRCNMDGSEFEVLGYNFRNNYEVTVDSFGALWQSDNDDDGNRATRINFVMEFGNYGYVDQITGEGWRAPRTNMEADIPQQHWHLNDPGVVPTMLITGAGSPTGITVYEGNLLPEVYRNQVLHCDAGPNVVRAYPTTNDGAGYKAEIVTMLVGEQDRWFRPADICVAPDGSVFVTDWYDPGVGGHNMQDMERGRLFRLAPPNHKYVVPAFDFSTAEGAVAAMQNPCLSVRFMAWEAIQKFAAKAVEPLQKLALNENPRWRARALWALGKLPGHGEEAQQMAWGDQDANVRMMGIRLARQLGTPVEKYASKVVRDGSPQVRRELAVALRFDKSDSMPKLWTELAKQHDGKDRWYLEALGIGAELRWSDCLSEYKKSASDAAPAAKLDIFWRSRAAEAATEVAKLLTDYSLADTEVARLLRSLDFHAKADRTEALTTLLTAAPAKNDVAAVRRDQLIIEAMLKLPEQNLADRADFAEVVQRVLARSKDRAEQLRILKQLGTKDSVARLVELGMTGEVDSTSVAAFEALLAANKAEDLTSIVLSNNVETASRAAEVLSLCNGRGTVKLMSELLLDAKSQPEARLALAKGLARTDQGAQVLLDSARSGKLPSEVRFITGSLLRSSRKDEIRKAAVELFPSPKSLGKEPVPPLAELLTRAGDAGSGEKVFKTTGTCANCHQVRGQGKVVGPDLTEIGSKLTREAMFVSVLDPSAGISHNFESYSALLESGQVIVGLMVSQTDDKVTLKDAQGIERSLPKNEIERLKKQEISLMPENLIEAVSTKDLVDIVEYMLTLKKAP
jgi:putative membrane-bound dehydrogenase-like protein